MKSARGIQFSLVLAIFFITHCGMAQSDPLAVVDDEPVRIIPQLDAFEQVVQIAHGKLTNTSPNAYSDITLFAEVYNDRNEVIGEGVGFLVNACGAGLLPGFALQPETIQPFQVQLELFEPNTVIDRVEINADGTSIEPEPRLDADLAGVTSVAHAEVIAVEWLDPLALRFATGCRRELFTEWDWFQYSQRTGKTIPVEHPRADEVTADLQRGLSLTDDDLFANAAITFAPNGRRVVYQAELNRLRTAEPNGQFPRLLYDTLYNRSLQGIHWFHDNNFLAYYFGAFGDPVYYFTANQEAQALSLPPDALPLSDIIPGVAPEGARAIIAGAFEDDTPGYYYKLLNQRAAPSLLFEAEPAGNNYPPPIFTEDDRIYLARPLDGQEQPTLQCFVLNVDDAPRDLTPLPLNLATDEQASWWIAPDGESIALAANGIHGGLWWIDLGVLPGCAAAG